MTILAQSPGRVNLIGEHTDYNGGLCLPFAIPLRTTVRLRPRTDRTVRVTSRQATEAAEHLLDELVPGSLSGWAAYVGGVLWALREDGWELPGMDIEVDSKIPLGAGLSSSAALECAVAVAVAQLTERPLDRPGRAHLAQLCVRAEGEFVGAPTGGMDQLAALLTEEHHALLLDFAVHDAQPVPLPLRDAGLTILVVDTGAGHALADGDSGYAVRRSECEAAAAALRMPGLRDAAPGRVERIDDLRLRARARHVVTESPRVMDAVAAIRTSDWVWLGSLLTASHTSLRDDFEVSTPELDAAVDAAIGAGALGARMTGGGFGGAAIALVADAGLDAVEAGVTDAFAARGWASPAYYRVHPSGAAGPVTAGG
jgi:galactokinase